MVYRRTISITLVSPSTQPPDTSLNENTGRSGPSTDLYPTSNPRKRQRPHDEETEMALFRRVRIKTEVKVLAAESRNRPSSAAHIDDDDPFSDPELLRMLQGEKELENELLAESEKTQLEIEWEARVREGIEEFEERWDFDLLLENAVDLASEAAVDQELYEREMRDERPSDSDNSDNSDEEDYSDEYDSDRSEEDIDMDYRFS